MNTGGDEMRTRFYLYVLVAIIVGAGVTQAEDSWRLESKVQPTDFFRPMASMRGTVDGADLAFDWLIANYDSVASKIPPTWLSSLPSYAGGCSMERLEKARGFFSQPEHEVDGTQASLRKVAEAVTDCVNLRKREGASVEAYLQ